MLRIALLGIVLLASGSSASLPAADWNQWRGPRRDGAAGDDRRLIDRLPDDGLKPVWRADSEIPGARSGGWSSPVIAGGKLYLYTHSKTKQSDKELPPKKFPYLAPEKRGGMSDAEYAEYERNRRDEDFERSKSYRYDERVYCLDATTGRVLWTNERPSVYTRFPQSSTPAVVDGRLYVLGAGLTAFCVDAETGKDIWSRKLPGKFADEHQQSSFVVAEGVAVVLAGRLFGIDARSGEIAWQGEDQVELDRHGSPIVWRPSDNPSATPGGPTLLLINLDGKDTLCVECKTGRERWRVRAEASHSTPLVVGERMLVYGSSRKKGLRAYRITADAAEPIWTYQGLCDPGSSPVVVGDKIYVQGEKRLACVDAASGQAAWTEGLDMNQPRYTSLVAADGKVIYAFEGILCFAADDQGYRRLMNGLIDNQGLLAEESAFRRLLDMDNLEKTAEGQKQAERLWSKRFSDSGPLPCASPALVDGRLYVRTRTGLACYDLNARK